MELNIVTDLHSMLKTMHVFPLNASWCKEIDTTLTYLHLFTTEKRKTRKNRKGSLEQQKRDPQKPKEILFFWRGSLITIT